MNTVDCKYYLVQMWSLAWQGGKVVIAASLAVGLVYYIKSTFLLEFSPQIEKPLCHNLETLFIHIFGLIATHFMDGSCRGLGMGLRNSNVKMSALKRQGDDLVSMPTLSDPTVEELNRPWIVERKDKLPPDVDKYRKVWVMGRYKVGKTSLLKWLGIRGATPSNLIHTRGEIFYTTSSWAKTLFVDTEGFDQPINVSEPEFRKRLVITHAHKAADAIILVVPMLSNHDMNLFQRNIKAIRSRRTFLFVVHNLISITTFKELKEYFTIFGNIFNRNDANLPEALQMSSSMEGNMLTTQHGIHQQGVTVNHFFLGSKDHLHAWNMSCIGNLRVRLGHIQTQCFPLISTLKESLRLVGSSTYAFDPHADGDVECILRETEDEEREGESYYELSFSKNITESMARVIGGNTILGYTLDYKWLPARVVVEPNGRFIRQRLLIGTSRVKILEVTIPYESCITIRFEYFNANNGTNEENDVPYSIVGGCEVSLWSKFMPYVFS